jgi:hypothetical protein
MGRLIVSAGLICLVFVTLTRGEPTSADEQAGFQNDPMVIELLSHAKHIRRCNDEARDLWDGLNHTEQENLRTILLNHPHPSGAMASLVRLLEDGRRAEAEELVKTTYGVDDRQAHIITSLIGLANGIESPEVSTPHSPDSSRRNGNNK